MKTETFLYFSLGEDGSGVKVGEFGSWMFAKFSHARFKTLTFFHLSVLIYKARLFVRINTRVKTMMSVNSLSLAHGRCSQHIRSSPQILSRAMFL